MTDKITTPQEALEAAAQVADTRAACCVGVMERSTLNDLARSAAIAAGEAETIAASIRALAARIPPAPDDKELTKIISDAIWYDLDGPPEYQADAILDALREAGALR